MTRTSWLPASGHSRLRPGESAPAQSQALGAAIAGLRAGPSGQHVAVCLITSCFCGTFKSAIYLIGYKTGYSLKGVKRREKEHR